MSPCSHASNTFKTQILLPEELDSHLWPLIQFHTRVEPKRVPRVVRTLRAAVRYWWANIPRMFVCQYERIHPPASVTSAVDVPQALAGFRLHVLARPTGWNQLDCSWAGFYIIRTYHEIAWRSQLTMAC